MTSLLLDVEPTVDKALVGACIFNPANLALARAHVTESMLDPQVRDFWAATCAVADRNESVDAVSVLHEMTRRYPRQDRGAIAYDLEGILAVPPYVYTVRYFLADLLRDEIDRIRAIPVRGDHLKQAANQIAKLEAQVRELVDCLGADVLADGATREALSELGQDRGRYLRLGLGDVDRKVGGLRPGTLTLVGARPADGKTSFVLGVAAFNARKGIKVWFASLEMAPAEVQHVVICSAANLDTRLDRWKPGDESIYRVVADRCATLPIIYTQDVELGSLVSKAREAVGHGARLLVVDYIQLVAVKNMRRNANRYEIVGEVTRSLKLLARETGACVLAPAQIARGTKGIPTLQCLRESGNLEQDADLVLFLHFPKPLRDQHDVVAEGVVAIGKNRRGETGKVTVGFRRHSQTWVDLARPGDDLL